MNPMQNSGERSERQRRHSSRVLPSSRVPIDRAIPMIWPLTEPADFDPWKQLDARLHAAGKGDLFDVLGIRHAGVAAELLRRFEEVSGLAALDDRLDEIRITQIIGRFGARFRE